uniref:Mitochondrial carrier protein n=1 Tax=Mycena chlorophos TaxID=658473 RepID=A0ABQ0M346_MYCCL|nr:predicted protein [Mycena chlorophos]
MPSAHSLASICFSFSALTLLTFVSVSTPVWSKIFFLRSDSVAFGVWGSSGSHVSVGYRFDAVHDFDDRTLNTPLFHNLTRALVLHPIAAGFSALALLSSLLVYNRTASAAAVFFSALGAVLSLLAFLFDMVLFGVAHDAFRKQNIGSQYGNACWMTLAGFISLSCAFVAASCGVLSLLADPAGLGAICPPSTLRSKIIPRSSLIPRTGGPGRATQTQSSADLYSDSSFMLTQTNGGTASFTFNGTAFTIFGSKRSNHGAAAFPNPRSSSQNTHDPVGLYQVTVDGTTFPADDGEAADPGIFQTPTFSSPLLTQGLHTVTFTNQGSTFVDIDFIEIMSSVGDAEEDLLVSTVQDTDVSSAGFSFEPQSQWGTNVPQVGTYSGSSGHGTATPGASMSYMASCCSSYVYDNFRTSAGDSVFLYGPVGPSYSPFSVSIDGGQAVSYSATKQFFHPQTLLFSAVNLGAGTHSVNISYTPAQPGQIFAIDYANVYTTKSLGGTSTLTTVNGSSSAKSSLSGGAIAAVIISILFILFIIAAMVFILRRRRRRRQQTMPTPMSQPPMRSPEFVAPVVYASQPQPQAQPQSRAVPSTRYPSTIVNYYANEARILTVDTQSQAGSSAYDTESPSSRYAPAMPAKTQPPPLPMNRASQFAPPAYMRDPGMVRLHPAQAMGSSQPTQNQRFLGFSPQLASYFIAGGFAGAASRTVVSPLERLKIIQQVQPQSSSTQYKGVWRSLVRMWREEGFRGFMRGNAINCVRIVPYSAVQFTAYETFKREMVCFFWLQGARHTQTFDCRCSGGNMLSFHHISTRFGNLAKAALSAAYHTSSSYAASELTIVGMTRKIVREEGGARALYRGLVATAMGVAPYVGINFAAYEFLRGVITPPGKTSVPRKLACGALAGGISQCLTYPFDVLRRKLQVSGMRSSGLNIQYTGAIDAMRGILKTEGFTGLYRGLWVNVLKVAPSVATSFFTYELVKEYLLGQ